MIDDYSDRLGFSLKSTDSVKITCLDNDYVEPHNLLAEHGWSSFISTPDTNILVDTGQTWQVLKHNSVQLKVDLDEINSVIVTHGHYDHTGAISSLIDSLPSSTKFIANPKVFEEKYSTKRRLRYIGLPRKGKEIEKIRRRVLTPLGPEKLADGVCTTGPIPRVTSFELPSEYLRVKREGKLEIDPFEDEQAILINVRDLGIILVSGCAHSGIVNTIKHVQNLIGEKIWGVVGGFHLRDANDLRIESTIRELKTLDLGLIAPAHCTGFKASAKIYQEFSSVFKVVSVGTDLKSE